MRKNFVFSGDGKNSNGMKYIKLFENKENPVYWVVPTDERLEDSLRQIGAPDEFIKNRLGGPRRYINGNNFDYFFIGFDGDTTTTDHPEYRWGWNGYDGGKFRDDFYDGRGYKFMGGVNFNEIEKLQLDAEKYNL